MVDDNEEEKFFRKRYADHLQQLKGDILIDEERQKVKHQAMKTPGRRGELIKNEEIDREIVRRHSSKSKDT